LADGRLATLLGYVDLARDGAREARALAWMHAHGTWIDWLDRESGARPRAVDVTPAYSSGLAGSQVLPMR
jgi:hypothetical protein